MNTHEPSRGHRTRWARPFIAATFLLQRLGDAVVLYAVNQPTNLDPVLQGLALASLIWTTVLTVGVWRRLRWARYVLATFSFLYVFGMSFAGLRHWEAYTLDRIDPRSLPVVAAVLYLAATAILVRSRRVRHFANQ